MTIRSIYIILLPISLLSYLITLFSTLDNNYIISTSLQEYGFLQIHYGLYYQCNNKYNLENKVKAKCKRIPNFNSKLCKENFNVCILWQVIGSLNLLCLFFGIIILMLKVNILLGRSNFRAIGWILLSIFLLVYGFSKGIMLITIAGVFNQFGKESIWFKVQLGSSFYVTLLSFFIDVFALVILLVSHFLIKFYFQKYYTRGARLLS